MLRYGAVVATLPYRLFKVIWVCGGGLGIMDREMAQRSTLFVADLATLGTAGVALLIALDFTHGWRRPSPPSTAPGRPPRSASPFRPLRPPSRPPTGSWSP
ncbi:hypothetical protein ACFWWM_12690 [Streptomyces sp. NPDC058682]|uniref:hypothetical protein n=1 Tax=Streptomyces sp. NPDC058682 TaxID=3346596 RepID=UPI0036612718